MARNRQRLQEQAAFFGVDVDELLAAQPADEKPPVIWYCNRHTWQLFMALQTQWDYAPMTGRLLRLNYSAADIQLQRLARRENLDEAVQDQLWSDLQLMEITVLNEAADMADAEDA